MPITAIPPTLQQSLTARLTASAQRARWRRSEHTTVHWHGMLVPNGMDGVGGLTHSVQTLLEQGDFGLGTFADLDGEMVVVDGRVYFLWARSTNSS
jgi:hypothetical protein